MSIVACVKVHDGIGLGADSMSQIIGKGPQGQIGPIKAYENAQKLFQIGALPVGVATYGIGNFGPRSVGSFLLEFGRRKDLKDNVEDLAVELHKFLGSAHEDLYGKLPEEQKPVLGLVVAGYSANKLLAEEWEFVIPKDSAPKSVRDADKFGASWRGISIFFTRLYRGYDPRITDGLKKSGVPDEIIAKVSNVAGEYGMPIAFDGMPLQDAIDFLSFILRTTIDATRFVVGLASCGGPLSVAIITREDGFEWIKEPKLALK